MIVSLVALTKRTVTGMTLRQREYPGAQGLAVDGRTHGVMVSPLLLDKRSSFISYMKWEKGS